jgi:hypothetical protein
MDKERIAVAYSAYTHSYSTSLIMATSQEQSGTLHTRLTMGNDLGRIGQPNDFEH